MNPGKVLVAGTGKMGRNIGLHLARHGWRVAWLGRDRERLDGAARWLGRRLRKLPDMAALGFFCLAEDASLPAVDLVIEAIEEDAEAKRVLLRDLDFRLPTPSPPLLSTTSSIFPQDLHPRLSVAHFFYPLELTGLVEFIPGPSLGASVVDGVIAALERTGLMVLRQDRRSAFLLNRLILPLQDACFRALLAGGVTPEEVDEASAASPLCPVGQLSLMDSVGLDVIAAAVDHYIGHMALEMVVVYTPLCRGLGKALALGRRGNKGGGGLLHGEPMDWEEAPYNKEKVQPDYARIMLQTCLDALERGHIDSPTLDEALAKLYGAETTVEEEKKRLGCG